MDIEQVTPGTEQVLRVLRSRAPWILACIVLVTGVTYGYYKHKTKRYTAVAALTFGSDQLDQQIAGLSGSSGLGPLAEQNTDLETVRVSNVAAETARQLGHGLTGETVNESLSVSAKGESSIVEVEATSTSPVLAAAIANTYVSLFVKSQRRTNSQFFKSALALVNKQLAGLSPAQRVGSDGLDLVERAHTLGLLAALGYNNAEVAEEGLVPTSPSSPKTKRNTALGAVLGLLLGIGIAFLLERFDRRIREPEALGAIYRLPMLGGIPKSTALSRSLRRSGKPLAPAEAEAFSLICAHLRFFNVDRDVRTVVIASPATGEGKTTIARHMAEAAARLGSQVLLVEADLRQPTVAQQLEIQSGPGLSGVLIGVISMREATHSIALEALPGEGTTGRMLDVLVAGDVLPPNPGELLGSHSMDVVLAQAKSAYDFVVVDTPPLTAVSDAFPLLTKVDGVIIIGWVGRSRRDVAEQLHQVLGSSGAPLLGVIANGSNAGSPNPYPSSVTRSIIADRADNSSPAEQLAPTAKT